MTVEEAKGVCNDRSKWKESLPTPKGNGHDVMYVCMQHRITHGLSFPTPISLSGVGTTCFSSCCDKDSAIIFTTGRLPDFNPP
jgi:hypothetical protein